MAPFGLELAVVGRTGPKFHYKGPKGLGSYNRAQGPYLGPQGALDRTKNQSKWSRTRLESVCPGFKLKRPHSDPFDEKLEIGLLLLFLHHHETATSLLVLHHHQS